MTNAVKENGLPRLYTNAMTEITLRQKIIADIQSREIKMGIRPAYEFCHLEMRMICELLAICCLAAHGDIPSTQTGRMKSAYEADWILKSLERLHPRFFPIPVSIEQRDGITTLTDNTDPALTKEDVINAYHQCGRVLHRGSIKNMGPLKTTREEFGPISVFRKKLLNLIAQHTVVLFIPGELVWVSVSVQEHRCNMRHLSALGKPRLPHEWRGTMLSDKNGE